MQQSPFKLPQRLVNSKIITIDEAETLMEARLIRNKIAHGQNDEKLTKEITLRYLEFFKSIQERLVSQNNNTEDS